MLVNYVTSSPPVPIVRGGMNQSPTGASPALNPSELYRTPVPLSDGNLIASNVRVNQSDYNTGSVASPAPVPGYLFRLRSLKAPSPGAQLVNDISLTTGININTSYYVGATLVAYNGLAWELDPVEVVSRNEPGATSAAPVHATTVSQFAASNVHIPTFQKYLSDNNAALSVSFDVTKRDRHDKQQPYNLRVAWSGHQTPLGAGTALGVIYDIAWQRFYQADFRRGYLLGSATPQAGRRVVATPMHTTMALNLPMANAPTGAVRIGNDGSVAAIVPASKALSWEMLNSDAALTSQVKERFWVTFQPGEIRTCTNCHGINTADQTGALGAPSNMPAALADLLTYWKSTHASGTMQFAAAVSNAIKSAGNVFISVLRGGGSTGPVSVNYATSNGTANAGIDYAQATGTLNWLDGDTAAKTITVALLNNVAAGANKTMNVTLASPTFGALGTSTAHVLTITAPSTLDIDGNGHYDALTDGLLIMRYLLGANNAALTVAALGAVPTRSDPLLHVAPYLNDIRSLLDVDGDGSVFPHTDGVILLRYLFGLRGSALTAGISGVGLRPTAQIESYIQSLMP